MKKDQTWTNPRNGIKCKRVGGAASFEIMLHGRIESKESWEEASNEVVDLISKVDKLLTKHIKGVSLGMYKIYPTELVKPIQEKQNGRTNTRS